MTKIGFKGRIIPESSRMNLRGLPEISYREEPLPPDLMQAIDMGFSINVQDSQIFVECNVDPYDDSLFGWVHRRLLSLLRDIYNLYSLSSGILLFVVLDTYLDPNGLERPIAQTTPHLAGISTVHTVDSSIPGSFGLGKLIPLVLQDRPLAAAIRDLIKSISDPNLAPVDCARAIEGLRAIFMPDPTKKKEGWELLQRNLCLSEDYLKHITKTSERPRHGNRDYISGAALREITTRSWIIMNRFLEFRLRGGSHPLPLSEFPLL
jgi:hypothetical protein